jgi:hypothetical protein
MQLDSLVVSGLAVDKSYYAHEEPLITHGAIEVENTGDQPVQLSIRKGSIHAGDKVIPLQGFFLYLLPDYEEKDPKGFQQPPHSKSRYEITFPHRSAAAAAASDIAVEFELAANGKSLSVRSSYTLTRRTPKSL